jgi:hypothetical protein
MNDRPPPRLVDFFDLVGRTNTAQLFQIAGAIAAGGIATLIDETPAFLGAAFPDLGGADLRRFVLLLVWAMHCQHVKTTAELARKWKLARTLGGSNEDAIDHALAEGAALAEQKFAEWALDLPPGGGANMTDRFMSALAERIAARVAAYQTNGGRS